MKKQTVRFQTRSLCSILLLAALATSQGRAQQPTVTIGTDQDNYVHYANYNGTVFYTNTVMGTAGTLSYMTVRGQNTLNNGQKGWMRFELGGQPYGANNGATVTVHIVGPLGRFRTVPLRLYALKSGFSPGAGILGTDWQEDEITWNNAPGNSLTDSRICDTSVATLIGAVYEGNPSAVGDPFVFTIPRLVDFIQADGSLTVMLTQGGQESGSNFATKEHATAAYRPKLTFVKQAWGSVISVR